ncbi:hypothetical protein [Metabacillus halosaccharovorans]|uniref:Uncharacterized protein n=1 Tax=Metabacillus halosaccharovorans TaxID=930124 RepID=A0ABT3DCE3_9BACI|nr:hypothetical protein [Metabacillus halosaccharovorans]MCV9884718.1 hypothetical protein [Metabacillus halosaccharovorans]
MVKLKVGDKVEAIQDFYFYDEFYQKGTLFVIDESQVNHNFEKFVTKVN